MLTTNQISFQAHNYPNQRMNVSTSKDNENILKLTDFHSLKQYWHSAPVYIRSLAGEKKKHLAVN
jgi:hypothetical protein